MADTQAIAAAFEAALQSDDFEAMTKLTMEYASDDFIQNWPQSGERINRANSLKLFESYGERTGTSPTFTYKRMLGGGDLFVIEGTIDYGDGVPVSYVGIGELRDGKVARMTEYFANPFPAPEWRAAFVERT
ncbi:MAG: nuclear transport factor 2 family protein [Chloroflexi bacterium]|nr:nuclear transport factor 2 family protein [Chloroflexota bacterium]